jgi:RHS repeat-associated protein
MGCLKLTYSQNNSHLKVAYSVYDESLKNCTGAYRYGFNGKENDLEITGWQDYGEREYDERLCRFISVDPISDEYPHYTPYAFAGNKPIECIDLDGLEDTHYTMYLDRMHSTSEGAAEANKTAQETAPAMEVAIGFTPLGPIADGISLLKDVFTGNWSAIPLDLAGFVPGGDVAKLKKLDKVVDMSKTMDRLNDTKKLTKKIDAVKVETKTTEKLSKVQKSKTTEPIGNGKYTKTTKVQPGKGPGQSRSEMKIYKNQDGKVIKTQKDSYDRGNKFQNKKPLRGGPEGRPAGG